MSERRQPSSERTPADRLARIEQRQQRLLSELDRLNERIESAISHFSGTPTPDA
ncbi:hypothetical protein [Botrimarina colliarenosi]|nr:hypothetical protein [Botrimarina colliarenosi]